MTLFAVHPWARVVAGLAASFWIGAAIGCGGALLLAGRRIRQLETINLLLRAKLRVREKAQRAGKTGTGPLLVMPTAGSERGPGQKPASRAAVGR